MQHGGIYEEEIAGKAYDTRILARFARYVSPYRVSIISVLLILPLVAACRLAQPWIIKLAIDGHITTGSMRRGEEHWVYGRRGKPCRRCGTPVRSAGQDDRVTYWCPSCQPGVSG